MSDVPYRSLFGRKYGGTVVRVFWPQFPRIRQSLIPVGSKAFGTGKIKSQMNVLFTVTIVFESFTL